MNSAAAYESAETNVVELLDMPDLDGRASADPAIMAPLREVIDAATCRAWAAETAGADPRADDARGFCQRVLYRLNRLRLYWFDSPAAYINERSRSLLDLQDCIEGPWQTWLARRVALEPRDIADPLAAIRQWVARDLEPIDSPFHQFFTREVDVEGYKRLLQIGSLNGLVEASQLSRTLGGAAGDVQCMLTRILFEEYGGGRAQRKHSTYFAVMLEQLGLSAEPEAYFEYAPWEVLAVINQAFYLAENKRFFIRFCGAFTYTEVSTPVSFRSYAAAARRLSLSDGRDDYWTLHIREDERHGQWMVEKVAKPMLERFPDFARDLLSGYAQQRFIEADAANATLRACQDITRREAAA